MPNSILHKRSSTSGVVPHAALLANGEIALNSADGTWFIKKTDGTVLDLRQPLITDGGAALNPDAQDWAARVTTAGGTVSAATLQAVNNFCNAINAAGIRDRFYRLNLFCGNNLAACLVPLYRGPSLGGTQFGNATDTNVNFASGDYAETGASGGLKGNGFNKRLETGFPANTVPVASRHLSAYEMLQATITNMCLLGVGDDGLGTYYFWIVKHVPATVTIAQFGTNAFGTAQTTGGNFLATQFPAAALYKGATVIGTGGAGGSPPTAGVTIPVFASNNANRHSDGRMGSYSIGLGMTADQVAAYNTAMTAFQTALLRNVAPVVSNADAQDWVNRVYAAGGTVSQSTADAVNTFCNTINSTGLRDRFYRLNLFCGNNLAACRVPLYRGPSLSGTQYGNTTDTNNSFVSGDYVETGATGGLKGDGSSKSLQTGFPGNTLATGNRHLAVYENQRDTTTYKGLIGIRDDGGGTYYFELGNGSPGTIVYGFVGGALAQVTGQTVGGHWLLSEPSSSSSVLYKNGTSVGTSASATRGTPPSFGIPVFALQVSPITNPSLFYHIASRLGAYSIGVSMTSTQAAAYSSAMQAFQTALTRAV